MKKLLTLLLTMSLMLSITACGGKGKETGSDDANVQTKVETSDKKDDEVKMPETEDGEVEIKKEEADTKGEDKTEISSNSSETTKPNTPAQSSKPTSSEHKHSYTSAVTKAATCSAAGTKTFTCSCGDSYTEKIAATGSHVWGQWKTIKEPTTTAQGTSQRKCNNCSATENQNIDKLCHYFYNDSLEGRWSASAITVVPKEVYFENGKLVAHCYIVNGYSTHATMVNISEISVTGRNDKVIAHAYFGAQNLSIAALSYVEHTFTFGADTIISTYVDMSRLGFDANFSANH